MRNRIQKLRRDNEKAQNQITIQEKRYNQISAIHTEKSDWNQMLDDYRLSSN